MKVHVVTCANRAHYRTEIDQMHRQRHRVFVEELGWSALRSDDGLEIDSFDDDSAVYLLAVDQDGVQGSLRLLPAWRRCMLTECFPEFLGGAPAPNGPGVWEWTRWCPGVIAKPRQLIKARRALIVAALEFAATRAIDAYFTFCEMKFLGQIEELGWKPVPLCLPRPFAEGVAIGVRWDVTSDLLSNARAEFGLAEAVSLEAPAWSARRGEFRPWMLQQLMALDNPDQVLAVEEALRLSAKPRRGGGRSLEAMPMAGTA